MRGAALLSIEGFSPRHGLDRKTALIPKIGHAPDGTSIRDKIFFVPAVKGGVAAGGALGDSAE